jgi:hypothetical protein
VASITIPFQMVEVLAGWHKVAQGHSDPTDTSLLKDHRWMPFFEPPDKPRDTLPLNLLVTSGQVPEDSQHGAGHCLAVDFLDTPHHLTGNTA